MKCNLCGINEAKVHFTEIINNDMKEIHLCEDCAKKKGMLKGDGDKINLSPMDDLLSGLINSITKQGVKESQKKKICPNCLISYDEFQKEVKFGCSQCYEVFNNEVEPLLKRIHGETNHIGKKPIKVSSPVLNQNDSNTEIPATAVKQNEINNLKSDLDKAIIEERYEDAAIIRDRIKELENSEEK